MELLLSSTPLPQRSLECAGDVAKQGRLQGVELVIPDRSNILSAEMEPVEALLADLQRRGSKNESCRVRWLMLPPNTSDAQFLYWERYAHVLRTGLVVQHPVDEVFAGVPVAITHGTCLTDAIEAASWARSHDAHTCWEIGPGACDLEEFDRVLEVTFPQLAHIRLLGTDLRVLGEPTRVNHVDVLMRMLARKQKHVTEPFSGTIALVPSVAGGKEAMQTPSVHASGWTCCTAA